MKKQWGFFSILFIAAAGIVSAQSNAVIDALIDKKEASCGEAFFLALSSAGLVRAEGTIADAMAYIETNKWEVSRTPDTPVSLGELCYVLMRAHNLPGGVMYAAFPGQRYATREFEFLGWVRRAPVPSRRVSGEEALQIIGQVLEFKTPTPAEGSAQ